MTADRLPVVKAPPLPAPNGSHDHRRAYLAAYAAELEARGYQVRVPDPDDERGNPTRGQTVGWLRVEGQLVRVVFDPDDRLLRGGWARVEVAMSAREVDTLRAIVARSRGRADRRLRTRNYAELGDPRGAELRAYDQEKAEFLGRLQARLAKVAAEGPAPSGRPRHTVPEPDELTLEGTP